MTDIDARLAQLEKANRRWKRIAISCAGALALVVLMAALSATTPIALAQEPKADAAKSPPVAYYSNYCHITFLPEELVLDFAMNTNTKDPPKSTLPGSNRVVVNYYTAKRLRDGLATVVKKYEDAFGPLELDLQKRAKGNKIH